MKKTLFSRIFPSMLGTVPSGDRPNVLMGPKTGRVIAFGLLATLGLSSGCAAYVQTMSDDANTNAARLAQEPQQRANPLEGRAVFGEPIKFDPGTATNHTATDPVKKKSTPTPVTP
jgi:hypothetical protein